MLGFLQRPPKVVTVRIQKARDLKNTYVDSKKWKKDNFKWKVKIKGGKKKLETESAKDPSGCPLWDFEATFTVVDVSQPIVLKVTDSDNHHVGQVVISLAKIPGRPNDPSKRPASPSRLCVSELEPTKKVSQVYGNLFYWIWAEEFYEDGNPTKSAKGSLLGSSNIHRSASRLSAAIHRHHDGDSASNIGSTLSVSGDKKKKLDLHLHRHRNKDKDGASIVGSTLSMYSTDEKKKSWYKRHDIKNIGKHIGRSSHLGGSKNGSEMSFKMSQSMNSLFPDVQGSNQDHPDGSIFGGSSEIGEVSDSFGVRSNYNANKISVENPMTESSTLMDSNGQNRSSSHISLESASDSNNGSPSQPLPAIPKRTNSRRDPPTISILKSVQESTFASSDEGEDLKPTEQERQLPASSQPPELLSLSPSSGSFNGDLQVHVYGIGLTPDAMEHAVLLVDDYTIAGYKWSLVSGSWMEEPRATHRITLRMPPRPSAQQGSVWVEVETMTKGRLRCSTPFLYQAVALNSDTHIPSGFAGGISNGLGDSNTASTATTPGSEPGYSQGFARNSSIRLSDKRSRLSFRGTKQESTARGELPPSLGGGGAKSSGFGSEDSVSESALSSKAADINASPNASDAGGRQVVADGFVRNSSIRLSDTRTRRGVRGAEAPVPKAAISNLDVGENLKTESVSEISNLNSLSSPTLVQAPSSLILAANKDETFVYSMPPALNTLNTVLEETGNSSDVDETNVIMLKPNLFESLEREKTPESKDVISDVEEVDFKVENKHPQSPAQRASETKLEVEAPSAKPIAAWDRSDTDEIVDSNNGPFVDQNLSEALKPETMYAKENGEEQNDSSKQSETDYSDDDDDDDDMEDFEKEEEESEAALHSGVRLSTIEENTRKKNAPENSPRFLRMEPNKGPTTGYFKVSLYGKGLADDVMKHAQVFVDVYTVPNQNWSISKVSEGAATHCLTISMPPMPAGDVWVEVETMSHGRIRSPFPFVYQSAMDGVDDQLGFASNFSIGYSMRGKGSSDNRFSLLQEVGISPTEEDDSGYLIHALDDEGIDLNKAKQMINELYDKINSVKMKLEVKIKDEFSVSKDLCFLRMRLLEDGKVKYLEKL